MRKVTRNEINKKNMVALGYCQIQTILKMLAEDYKIGYNAGVYGWNYDLYRIDGIDIVTGYNVPYYNLSNKEIKNKLIELENKIRKDFDYTNYEAQYKKYKKRFFEIFE